MAKDRISFLQIMLLAVVAPSAVAAASLPSDIFGRQASSTTTTTTCASGFNQCSQSGLPGNFCCSADTTCSVLAGNSTVLCCPKGSDCSKINPIVCDLSQQDATAHPDAPIKTTALNGTLPRCGEGLCCPWGYTCSANARCVAQADQTAFPPDNTPVTSTTSTKKPPMGTASSTPNAVNATAQTSGDSSSSSGGGGGGTQVGTIVGAVVGVIAGLLIIGIVICLLLARQKKKQQRHGGGRTTTTTGGNSNMTMSPSLMLRYKTNSNKHGSTSSFGNILANPVTISSPKPQGNGTTAFRTDFIRKSPMSSPDSSRAPTRDSRFGGSTLHRTPSDASYSLPATPPRSRGGVGGRFSDDDPPIRIAPIRHMRVPPVTPPAQREPSQEINIFADPSTVGRHRDNHRDSDSRMTTFTAMMESAALGEVYRGKPFVPDSVTNSPASRRGR